MAKKELDEVREVLFKALEAVRYRLPDGRSKSIVYTKLQEAILWLDSDETLKEK